MSQCEGLQTALQLDSLRASHAIDVEIRNGPDIDEIFDDISYLKGTSLIRMLDGHLGREMLLKGVNSYLAGFAYGVSLCLLLLLFITHPDREYHFSRFVGSLEPSIGKRCRIIHGTLAASVTGLRLLGCMLTRTL